MMPHSLTLNTDFEWTDCQICVSVVALLTTIRRTYRLWYVGELLDPPVYPTLVRIIPLAQPNCASGNQNQLSAKVAFSVGMSGSLRGIVDRGNCGRRQNRS